MSTWEDKQPVSIGYKAKNNRKTTRGRKRIKLGSSLVHENRKSFQTTRNYHFANKPSMQGGVCVWNRGTYVRAIHGEIGSRKKQSK